LKKLLFLLVILGSMQVMAAMEESIKKLKIIDDKIELNQQLFEKIEKKSSLQEILNLIDKGANVNAKDIGGSTPLLCATGQGLSDVCFKLMDKGADVNAKNKSGYTPLHSAAFAGLSDVCLKLIESGADVNVKNKDGFTALIESAWNGLSEVCLKLIDKGANVNAKDDNGRTPLINAANRDLSEVCLKLIDKGADVNAQNKNGNTALINAARKGFKDVCKAILVHSVIMPKTVDKIDESSKKLLTALCVFKRLKLPKDIRDLILNRNELKDEYLTELIYLIQKGNQLPEPYRKTVATKIAENTIAQLKPLMVKAREEAKTPEIETILDKDLLEECYGDQIHKNIMDNLEFLVRRAL